MSNNATSSTSRSADGSLTMTSTGVGAALLGLVQFLPIDWQAIAIAIIPIISPTLSWFLLYLYYKFAEPLPVIQARASLKRDLKELRVILEDKNASIKFKRDAQKEYDATLLAIANLNKKHLKLDKEINILLDNKEDN